MKRIFLNLATLALIIFLFTNGILWNKPKPHAYDHNHPAWKEWVLDYMNKGIPLIGIYEKPGFMYWVFGTISIHPIVVNSEGKWEWLDKDTWKPLPANAIYHFD